MIDKDTFRHYADPLTEAANKMNMAIGRALRDVYREAIKDPDNIGRLRDEFDRQVSKAVRQWRAARVKWVEEELPAAYRKGVSLADAELKELQKMGYSIPEPAEEFSDNVPLLRDARPF